MSVGSSGLLALPPSSTTLSSHLTQHPPHPQTHIHSCLPSLLGPMELLPPPLPPLLHKLASSPHYVSSTKSFSSHPTPPRSRPILKLGPGQQFQNP